MSLEVDAGEWSGMTRDMSAAGAFIVTPETLQIGGEVEFSLTLRQAGQEFRFHFEGRVTRVESRAGERGVGVQIESFRLGGPQVAGQGPEAVGTRH
jgi:hypothetical protein